MKIQWTEDLSVGVDQIDSQHKELFDRVNALYISIDRGRSFQEIGAVFRFLEDYVAYHFGAEEKYMAEYGYEDYSAHKDQHDGFVKDVVELKKEFETIGGTSNLVLQVQRTVGDWVINHVCKVDRAFGDFLKTKL